MLAPASSPAAAVAPAPRVQTRSFSYRSSTGSTRTAYVVLPSWYGPSHDPPLPLVISPHGRGVDGRYNLRFWGDLPARGRFALVSPDGQGRRLPLYSWGYRGQVDDLARMPALVVQAFPWLRLARGRTYAIGSSMGAQEVLLLAERPGVPLAGVAAFDPVTDMAARYRAWFTTPGEQRLPALGRIEIGGTPSQVPAAYAARSPKTFVATLARRRIPLVFWWSRRDRIVTDEATETGRFVQRLRRLAPRAHVDEVVGWWQHAHEMHPGTQLPAALACLGLLPARGITVPAYDVVDGSIHEAAPESGRPPVPFSRAFCRD